MLSGVGNKGHLQRFGIPVLMDLPVGNNFQNNPITSIFIEITSPDYYLTAPFVNLDQLSERYYNNTGPLGTNIELGVRWNTAKNRDTNDANALLFITAFDERTIIFSLNLARVRSRGTIMIQSASPYIAPKIDPNYYGHPNDFEDMLDALRFIMFVLESPKSDLGRIISLPSFESMGCPVCAEKYMYECIEGLRCYIRQNTISSYHPGGSCKMGPPHKNDVVVDMSLRVKNIHKLRVCDASIFPQNINGNPMAAALMVGEKCAQIIKDSHHSGLR